MSNQQTRIVGVCASCGHGVPADAPVMDGSLICPTCGKIYGAKPSPVEPPSPELLRAEIFRLWTTLSFVMPMRLKDSGQNLTDEIVDREMTSAVLDELTQKYSISRDAALQALKKARRSVS